MDSGVAQRRLLVANLLFSVALSSCDKTVIIPAPVAVVEVSPETSSLASGESLQLTARVVGEGGHTLTGRTITWSSH